MPSTPSASTARACRRHHASAAAEVKSTIDPRPIHQRPTCSSADTGRLHLLFQGDPDHTGFDNLAFLTRRQLAVVEDRGDTLHTQLDALDSGWVVDATADFSRRGAPAPVRFLAEGRDPSATIDSALLDAGTPGFRNDGDNEITGIHVSDGDPTAAGLLGAKDPRPSPAAVTRAGAVRTRPGASSGRSSTATT
jgi:hypothetical protein